MHIFIKLISYIFIFPLFNCQFQPDFVGTWGMKREDYKFKALYRVSLRLT